MCASTEVKSIGNKDTNRLADDVDARANRHGTGAAL